MKIIKNVKTKILLCFLLLMCFSGCSNEKEEKYFNSYSELENGNIALWIGTSFSDHVEKFIPTAKLNGLNFLADMISGMMDDKYDAVCYCDVLYPNLKREFPNITYLNDYHDPIEFASVFASNAHGNELKNKYNAFLKEIKEDGRREALIDEWINKPEHNYEGLNEWDGSNGTLKAFTGSSTPPFIYVCNNEISGFEYALFAEFAKEYGYHVEYEICEFNALIPSVEANRCDVCLSGINTTEESKETVNYSDSIYDSEIVLYVKEDPNNIGEYSSIDQLNGLKTSNVVGSVLPAIHQERFPDSEVLEFNSYTDAVLALINNKIDFVLTDRSQCVAISRNSKEVTFIDESVFKQEIAFYFSKNNEKSQTIKRQMDEYIANHQKELKDLKDRWENDLDYHSTFDKELTGENGTITLATTGNSQPFSFMQDEKLTGLDIDIVSNFCFEYGYKLENQIVDYNAIMASVASGKVDIGATGICITEERKEVVDFSLPYCEEDICVIVRTNPSQKSFFESIKDSFIKNFIKESRYKMIIEGIFTTVRISLLSIILGTIIGFIFYLICRNGNKVVNRIFNVASVICRGLPMIVILMILYYVIFGKTSLSGEIVSIMSFSLTFALSVLGMIKTAVKAIDVGQSEAAYSLGFTDTQTFFNIVLPQALILFLPSYKGGIVSLIQGTAVVGYIAVCDLTKMSDMIRARTFEAFFPLITTALIYFAIEQLMTLIVKGIEIKAEPEKRSKEEILKKFEK